MKKSAVAVPGARRAMEMVPSLCDSPVALVLSWATGGKALSVDHNSSLRHILSSRLSSSLADAPDIVTGSGAISANSSVDIGLGLIATSPSLSWTGNIALATQSQIILSGGVAVTGSLTLANNSGADFLVSGGAANTVTGGVSCPTAGTTVTSYVTNPKNVTPNVPIASTPGHCLQD